MAYSGIGIPSQAGSNGDEFFQQYREISCSCCGKHICLQDRKTKEYFCTMNCCSFSQVNSSSHNIPQAPPVLPYIAHPVNLIDYNQGQAQGQAHGLGQGQLPFGPLNSSFVGIAPQDRSSVRSQGPNQPQLHEQMQMGSPMANQGPNRIYQQQQQGQRSGMANSSYGRRYEHNNGGQDVVESGPPPQRRGRNEYTSTRNQDINRFVPQRGRGRGSNMGRCHEDPDARRGYDNGRGRGRGGSYGNQNQSAQLPQDDDDAWNFD